MDISAVSTLANSNNTSAVADKLKNNVKNLSSDSTEDELKSTLKDFESYFCLLYTSPSPRDTR